MHFNFSRLIAVLTAYVFFPSAFSAQAVDLNGKRVSFLRTFSYSSSHAIKGGRDNIPSSLQEVNRSVDFNNTLHVRIKQTYEGYPIWGGDGVIHIPQGSAFIKSNFLSTAESIPASTMNGTVFEGLEKDLINTPSYIFTPLQADKALTKAIEIFQTGNGNKGQIVDKKSQLMVYLDDEKKAHWTYRISLYVTSTDAAPAMPIMIMDALTFNIYKQWDNIQTYESAAGGGYGGNTKMGKLSYGLKDGLPSLDIERDANTNTCYLQNNVVIVSDYRINKDKAVTFPCEKVDIEHNNLYWDGESDQINGGYSPNHDALYLGKIINEMYTKWYTLSGALTKNGSAEVLSMVTHSPNYRLGNKGPEPDNAYWDPYLERMFFGDGKTLFYPTTSLAVASHEISHGFTAQHSNLAYVDQSGGMNEAFSDMAAKAAEYYVNNENDWEIGAEIIKLDEVPSLRSMDQPSKDCTWRHKQYGPSSQCSIDSAAEYDPKHPLNVHFLSGVYNRAFYLLATTQGWNTRKAFDVMVLANQHYWTPTTTFEEGACNVISAAKEYGYDTKAVIDAFASVAVSTSTCS